MCRVSISTCIKASVGSSGKWVLGEHNARFNVKTLNSLNCPRVCWFWRLETRRHFSYQKRNGYLFLTRKRTLKVRIRSLLSLLKKLECIPATVLFIQGVLLKPAVSCLKPNQYANPNKQQDRNTFRYAQFARCVLGV